MNYSDALSFVFHDKDWVKKVAIGGALAFAASILGLFFIFGFFVMGYYIGVIRNASKGLDPTLPEWANLGKIFVDGVLGSIIFVVYLLAVGAVCAAVIVFFATDRQIGEAERVIAIVTVSVLSLLALFVFTNAGVLKFAETDDLGIAFNFSRVFQLFRDDFGNFIAIAVFSFILNCILFLAGLGIFSPLTNFWGLLVQAHLFGQYAKLNRAATAATGG